MHNLYIIDTLAPFSLPSNKNVINWSKVDFAALEADGRLPIATQRVIIKRFRHYCARVTALGYDSISIDDLAHMAQCDFYGPDLLPLIVDYHHLYKQLFAIAKQHKLRIFVNSDYLFFNADIRQYLAQNAIAPLDFYQSIIERVLIDFPEIDGIILRIGESDGKDVDGTFLSQLLLKTPAQANQLLTHILPIFERYNKKLIFRTWTVGVYKIGDLIWNEKTYDAVFASINSDALIISMKFGDTDFMRYLALNPLFSHGHHKKILELQTRREWEGMGEFPSFTGWEYAAYWNQLAHNKNIVGIHVWCQTGGWANKTWSAITYFDKRAFWNELNTEVTINVTKFGSSVEDAITSFCNERHITDVGKFTELLRLSDTAIAKGLYIPTIAKQPLYFRRTRIPPLTWLTWDTAHLSSIVLSIHQSLIPSFNVVISDAKEAVVATGQMIEIAKSVKLPHYLIDTLEFEFATLDLFVDLKRYLFAQLSSQQTKSLNRKIISYTHRYPQHYIISPLNPIIKHTQPPRFLLNTFVRGGQSYRKRDHILLKTSPVQALLVRLYLRKTKSHLADQSMGFEVFFK